MLFHEIIGEGAALRPEGDALRLGGDGISFSAFAELVDHAAAAIQRQGITPGDRVAIYMPKSFEALAMMFGTARAGGVFVPVNPVLKGRQAAHILRDSGSTLLLTTPERRRALDGQGLDSLATIEVGKGSQGASSWDQFVAPGGAPSDIATKPDDLAALLYTSGSTGAPKGVMLSHANLTIGAQSVASYLGNTPDDRILCVLPLSFDYGLSQISTALLSGATAVLLDYLFPQDVVKALEAETITGLGCVPPLWLQLLSVDWPPGIADTLRYITSSGGAVPQMVLDGLRERLPETQVYLMYGLTEAFRSTYLDPALVDARPDSIGKAIPNARVDVITSDGRSAETDEVGELVHSGPLVAQGYWNDPERSSQRFRPLPEAFNVEGLSVWSGDLVRRDADGFLYFVERGDNMIKTSGYRVSPTEVEEVIYEIDGVAEAAAFGAGHLELGQAIVAAVVLTSDDAVSSDEILAHCRQQLPGYMVPRAIVLRETLPRNPNGKIDRSLLDGELSRLFTG